MGKRNSKKNRQKQSNRAIENKTSENKTSENKISENKVLENNALDNKVLESKVLENEGSENKVSENSVVNEVSKANESVSEAVKESFEQINSDDQWSIDNEETPVHLIEGEELYHVTEDEKSDYELPKKKHIDSRNILSFVTFILGVAVIVLVVLFKQSVNDSTEAVRVNETLNDQIKSLSNDYDSLKAELAEATEKNKLLSDSLNAKSLELESLSTETVNQHIPFSYPLKGTAAIKNDEIELEDEFIEGQDNTEETDGADEVVDENVTNDIVYFVCDSGTRVIATGAGVVESVTKKESENEVTGHLDFMGNFIADQNYDTYEIVIDHGNGYKTIYTASGSILIDEGDVVNKSSVILFIERSDTIFGYQVQLEGEFVDPLSCMEISG